jgi:NADPH-dependent curcumin reductase CurA
MADRYKKLVATTFSTDFREAATIVEEEIPQPGPQEVLVRNKYAAVNATDVNISAGRYEEGAEPPLDLGVEAAGVVVEVGDEVKHLEEGDSVVTSTLGGGYREYHVLHASNAIQVPQPSPEALSIMVSGLTASIALEEVGTLNHDETVLVTAAAGGTGQYAVQLAKQAGNHVVGTCGTEEKVSFLEDLGCDRPIHYREEDVGAVLADEYPEGVDLVYESVGGDLFDTCVEALARHGRLLSIGYVSEYKDGPERVTDERIYTTLIAKSASVRGFFLPHFAEHFHSHMNKLLRQHRGGTLDIAIDEASFEGVEAVPDAVEHLQSGQSLGKVVVRFPGED